MITTITNRKGGTGKTTTAFTIGTGIAKRGYKVLLIDLDSQANLTLNTGLKPSEDIIKVLQNEKPITEAIKKASAVDIIPASFYLSNMDLMLTETGKEYRLKEALNPIKKEYDFILIDTPAQLGVVTVNALTTSNNILIPTQADIFSLTGLEVLHDTIQAVRRYTNPDLYISGIILTRYNKRTIIARDMKENIKEYAESIHTKVYKTEVRECTAIKEASAMQQSIFEYAPRSNASADYTAIIEEYLKEFKQ